MTKLQAIIQRLTELTRQGKLTWKATANESTLLAVFGDQSILIQKVAPLFIPSVGSVYSLRVLNNIGTVVDRSDSNDLEELYTLAESTAKAGELDKLLQKLNAS